MYIVNRLPVNLLPVTVLFRLVLLLLLLGFLAYGTDIRRDDIIALLPAALTRAKVSRDGAGRLRFGLG